MTEQEIFIVSKRKSKERKCFWILQKYGFLIDCEEKELRDISRKNLPELTEVENNTFIQWKERLFKKKDVAIKVYSLRNPKPTEKISDLIDNSGGEHLQQIFKTFKKYTEEETEKELSAYPKKDFEDLLKEISNTLLEETQELLRKFISNKDDNISAKELIKELIKHFDGREKSKMK